jgi:cytidine deaminase
METITSEQWQQLAQLAEKARSKAYAPYSGYLVGCAALYLDENRITQVTHGANIENASYGLTMCAERVALSTALMNGAKRFIAVAIATQGPMPASPCGACRQFLAEFSESLPVALVVGGEIKELTDNSILLPKSFASKFLNKSRLY